MVEGKPSASASELISVITSLTADDLDPMVGSIQAMSLVRSLLYDNIGQLPYPYVYREDKADQLFTDFVAAHKIGGDRAMLVELERRIIQLGVGQEHVLKEVAARIGKKYTESNSGTSL